MLDTSKAVEFITRHGTDLDRYKYNFLFEKYRNDDEAVGFFEKSELESGGFPYLLDKQNPLSICETAFQLGSMVELDLFTTPLFQRTKNFLLSVQKDDSGWDENPELKKIGHSKYFAPGEIGTRTWLTGEIIRLIARDDEHENPALKKACRFILDRFKGHSIEGSKISSFLALASMAWTQTENLEITRELSDVTGEWASAEQDGFLLGWYMDSLIESSHMEGVFICLRSLQVGQNEDGLWSSAEFPERPARTVLTALRHLRWGKRW